MIDLTNEELTIILGFYYFELKRRNDTSLQGFTQKFNRFFYQNLSEQSLTYYCSLFKNVDSSFNATPIANSDERIQKFWNYYIEEDRIEELRKKYREFTKQLVAFPIFSDDENADEELSNIISTCSFTFIEDKPKEKYLDTKGSSLRRMRDLNVSFNALKLANFSCECDHNHLTFIRKNTAIPYTEGHHIIPLKFQNQFDVNLDVEANIVSLCSTCHKQIHYGKNYEEILKKIFTDERKERLRKCGIEITLERLIEMYR